VKPVKLKLKLDLTRHLKRGNPWVFKDALQPLPSPEVGLAHLYNSKNELMGLGLYEPSINLCFRMLHLGSTSFTSQIFSFRLQRAWDQRQIYRSDEHNCYRLVNGEGDELSGLVIDIYGPYAVVKTDGEAARKFWLEQNIVDHLLKLPLKLDCIFLKHHHREKTPGQILWGTDTGLHEALIIEYGMKYHSHLIEGAKTGFFLDQRENRHLIRKIAASKTVLNLFSYTGGFSIAAGLGGATQVTSVDIAPKAIEAAVHNWKLNHLPSTHQALTQDVFVWIKESKEKWDLVIVDPPSLAPNEKAKDEAMRAYQELFTQCIKLVKSNGLIALSSCTGHISYEEFLEICVLSISKANRKGRVLQIQGQPIDHPFPLVLPQMRYLKFVLLQLD
jgi:23S rRNA (cytosine1962-C5)-methyltransferase